MVGSLEYDIDRLLYLHQISKKDTQRIKFLSKYLEPYKVDFVKYISESLYRFPELRELITEEFITQFKNLISDWYDRLFEGKYDIAYLHYLMSVGERFVEVGFSPHHITVLMDLIRNYFNTRIFEHIKQSQEPELIEKFRSALKSLNKVLDLNLDIIISHYVDIETKKFLLLGKWGKQILNIATRFGLALDSLILFGLILLAFFIVYLLVNDILHIFSDKNMAHGIIAALGDLLILWTILELLNSQIKFMLGGEFAISSFVSVALAATIREALIASLEHNKPVEFKLTLAVIILVLGIVFGIVKWFEIKESKKRVLVRI
ncbi:MAG: hypothetical protein DSZ31_04395 [Gammaproteobacteria bacterium]|nr:MAG: hypothetical protein DSZ31_04395 [Gammaproteobacteria bacterium]RTZ67670.1 MAG: hypothetical protein DSZ30_05400 [Aquificaceae bacterium]